MRCWDRRGRALAAFYGLPSKRGRTHTPFRLGDAIARYRLVLSNPRSFVCYGVVFLEGGAIYGITPFIGDLLQARGAGGLREAGFVIGGLGVGGLTMPPLRRSSSHSQPDR